MQQSSNSQVIDDTGTLLTLLKPAKQIVSLTATGLDILFELGLQPVGYLTKGIANRPEFYGDQAQQIASVGSWMFPQINRIKALQPDLILGWAFPHRFYKPWLNNIAPVYLMNKTGYEVTLQRLRDVGDLCDRTDAAEIAIAQFEQCLDIYRNSITTPRKTVLMMGGSSLNRWMGKFLVETDRCTLGSILQQLTHYPWHQPQNHRGEPGLMTLSLRDILAVNPDIIFVQTYSPSKVPLSQQLTNHALWQQLQAVQNHQVYEVDQYWHSGTGTRMLRLILDQLLPKIYPNLR